MLLKWYELVGNFASRIFLMAGTNTGNILVDASPPRASEPLFVHGTCRYRCNVSPRLIEPLRRQQGVDYDFGTGAGLSLLAFCQITRSLQSTPSRAVAASVTWAEFYAR
jgi:hypothetical protein